MSNIPSDLQKIFFYSSRSVHKYYREREREKKTHRSYKRGLCRRGRVKVSRSERRCCTAITAAATTHISSAPKWFDFLGERWHGGFSFGKNNGIPMTGRAREPRPRKRCDRLRLSALRKIASGVCVCMYVCECMCVRENSASGYLYYFNTRPGQYATINSCFFFPYWSICFFF